MDYSPTVSPGIRVPTLPQWLVPESTDINSGDFRGHENFSERPHESSVDPHQLLLINHISLVEHDPDLLVLPS